jgi:ppGpp synthetase/RelA/SpoT-type nucleotidyltranferase
VTHVQDLPVEVQVRTSWQHEWAEFIEKVSDRIGRAIRYEGEVDLNSVLDSLSIPRDSPNEVRAGIRELYDTVLTLANKMSHAISAAEVAHGVAGDAAEKIIGLVNEQMRDTIAVLDSMSINRTA